MKLRKNWARTVSAVAVAGLLLSACTGKAAPVSSGSKPVEASSGNGREMVGNMYTTGYPLVKEQETFKILMNNAVDPAQMKLWQDYEAKTNVKVQWDFYDYDTCFEKKDLMYASQDYPDAVGTWCIEDKDIITYADDVYIPVDEAIAKYAPNITAALDNFPNARANMTTPNGHIYGFGIMGPQDDCGWIMHINKKWLANLNLQVPTTLAEFETVLQAFKDQDANGNGDVNDEIPLSFYDDTNYNYGGLFGAFGRLDNKDHLVMENGKVTFTANKEEYKNAIKWMNQLFTKQLIDTEAFTQDAIQYGTKGKSGDSSVYGVFLDFTGVNVVNQERYEAEYQSLAPLKGADGKQLWTEGDRWIFRNQMAITTAAKNPDTIVRWIDGLYDPEMSYEVCYGQLGTYTEKNADGKYQYKPFPEGTNESDIRNNQTVSALPYCIMPEFNANIVPNPSKMIKQNADKAVAPFVTKEPYPTVWKTNEQTEALSIITGDIKKLVDDKRVQWITGQADIDAEWDEYVKNLDSMKLKDYVEINQQAVDSYMKNA